MTQAPQSHAGPHGGRASARAEPCEAPGLVTHLNWALGLDESRIPDILSVVRQWEDPNEGAGFFNACESMAERKFALGMLLGATCESLEWLTTSTGQHCVLVTRSDRRIAVLPQLEVCGRFRVDFALVHQRTPWLQDRLAVEIDGHDFHDRTKEQAAADRSRDRALLAAGYHPVRFTGSEVHADPAGCASEAIDVLISLVGRIEAYRRDSWAKGYQRAEEQVDSEVRQAFAAGRRLQRVIGGRP